MSISLYNFEKAVSSLKNYWGVVGLFGGNPVLHPKFEQLCEILTEYIPFNQRGIWCNNPLKHAALLRKTFNPKISNLNVHLDQKAYNAFKEGWPECEPVGLYEDSRHSPVHGSMKTLVPDKSVRDELINNCDINKYWSAMVCQFRGEARGFFCEVAGAQAMLHQYIPDYPDTGIPIICTECTINKPSCNTCHGKQWWEHPMEYYNQQVEQHCHNCLVPLKGYGELACNKDGIEQTTHDLVQLGIYTPKSTVRAVEVLNSIDQLKPDSLITTDYINNSKK